MGRGSRHSKNAGGYGSEALTYHEKRALGHGTITERLGKVSRPAPADPSTSIFRVVTENSRPQ